MATPPDAPTFHHRERPWGGIITCSIAAAAFAVFAACFFSSQDRLALSIPLVGFVVSLLIITFLPTRSVSIDDTGITLSRTNILGIFATSRHIPRDTIRRIRYRSDIYDIREGSWDTKELRYFIDLFTRDGEIINLFTSRTFPLDRNLGKRLATHLHTEYEEYLVDRA